MSSGAFVAKRFLAGVNGDYVNADYIIRIYVQADKLYAQMTSGVDIELVNRAPEGSPLVGRIVMVSM